MLPGFGFEVQVWFINQPNQVLGYRVDGKEKGMHHVGDYLIKTRLKFTCRVIELI